MKIDFGTLAFGYTVKSGGGTPNWATALGQGKEYKINNDPEIDEILKGVVYSSTSLSQIKTKIGKGGRMVAGDAADSPIILAAVFSKVYINSEIIKGGKFVLLVTRDTSASHAGRLRFKYGPSNTYISNGEVYSNENFFALARNQLGLKDSACWFVYDICVANQNELILNAVIVDSEKSIEYADSRDMHFHWDALIEEQEPYRKNIEQQFVIDNLQPEWFKIKALELMDFDKKVQPLYENFRQDYSPNILASLSGKALLTKIFLNQDNKNNMCHLMEYDKDNRLYFGSIKNGNAYKYGLYYSKKEKSWMTGTNSNPEKIDEDEAIIVAEEIRDYLVNGASVLEEYASLDSIDDFNEVYEKLVDVTGGYIKRVWFMKYYHMIFQNLFPPIYSENAQRIALETIGINPESTPFGRLGQLALFVKECGISNVMFNHIMWYYAVSENMSEEGSIEETSNMKNCLEITKQPRTNKIHPINFIVYGAPGTGKTYSMVEYALAIIDNIAIEDFRKINTDRKANVNRYKSLVKEGQIVFTTFHQNYGYEEFIQGLRPDKDSETMAFKTVDGVFKVIADTALNDNDDKNYVIIIDEINRANISKVFGELITLIEEDKRWGEINETSVTLQSGDAFAVPNNLYIVGTMNSADKSISLIDAALRRRFDFVEQKPDLGLVKDKVLRDILENINTSLVQELDSTDLLVGHSYFMNKEEKDLCNILNNNIIPLLYEYFYDNRKKVAKLLSEAIEKANAKVVIVDEKVGRLRVKDKVE